MIQKLASETLTGFKNIDYKTDKYIDTMMMDIYIPIKK